ncbi:variable surface lipoprotein, partial [Mycoplasmopsis agalactiae]|uniref:variable surface lipoprotein n=1 Tax=Mycoplasmopsis agalactiae TaxID=2110 RepID=UPI000569B9A2
MKKSKFLLLGSLSSLVAIPFVAAKCGDTKGDEKKPAETTPGNPAETPGGSQNNPGGNKNPGTEGGSSSSTTPGTSINPETPLQPNPGTAPSVPAKPGKTPERMANDTDVSGADISGPITTPDVTV